LTYITDQGGVPMKKMIQSIIVVTAALCLAWISASVAHGGTFEASSVNAAGGQVRDSEGEIERNGDYKVEVRTARAATTFEVCLAVEDGLNAFLRDAVSDEDGELQVESNFGQDRPDLFAPGTPVTLRAPRFEVRANSAANNCRGTLLFESGLVVTVGVESPQEEESPEDD
jgi:hypothetical protein